MGKVKTTAVSEKELLRRINRVIVRGGYVLRRVRGQDAQRHLGRWCLMDYKRQLILAKDIDLESQALNMELLRPGEELVLD